MPRRALSPLSSIAVSSRDSIRGRAIHVIVFEQTEGHLYLT